MINFDFFLI